MTVKVKFALEENRLAGGHVKVLVRAMKGHHIWQGSLADRQGKSGSHDRVGKSGRRDKASHVYAWMQNVGRVTHERKLAGCLWQAQEA